LLAPGVEGLLPGPDHARAEAKFAGHLGRALALIGDPADRPGLEFRLERPSSLIHDPVVGD
jgi:hypothetical protein